LLPQREGMQRPWRDWTRWRKSLNENLAPLRRYLRSQVGRPWNKVFSEISQHLRPDSAVQKHVLDHLKQDVATVVVLAGGEWIAQDGRLLFRSYGPLFFVCPRTGLLRENHLRGKFKRRKAPTPPPRIDIDAARQFHQVNGLWYELRLGAITPEHFGRWDCHLHAAVTLSLVGRATAAYGRPAFAVSKRQLSKRDIRRHGLVRTRAG